jgi:RNA polymerase sigma-70 factor (family 1)
MRSLPDIQLLQVRIARDNDQHAYKELFVSFYPSLYSLSLSFLKSGYLAEEAVSDVFIKVWKKRAGLARISNLKLYLFRSIKNTSLNYLKQQNRSLIEPENYKVQLQSIYFDPEQLMLTAEMIGLVQKAIQQLPPRCQLIFKLVKEDGLKYKEVAELLNLSLKTVENQMTIAIRKIGEAISFDIRATLSFGN